MGVNHFAIDASSHGIDQRRLDGVNLAAAVFFNLTQDHLDYHGTMGAYRASKLRLTDTLLPREGTAVLNADSDAYGAFASASVMAGHSLMSVGAEGQGVRLLSRTPTAEGQRLALGFGGITPPEIDDGVAVLAEVLEDLRRRPSRAAGVR